MDILLSRTYAYSAYSRFVTVHAYSCTITLPRNIYSIKFSCNRCNETNAISFLSLSLSLSLLFLFFFLFSFLFSFYFSFLFLSLSFSFSFFFYKDSPWKSMFVLSELEEGCKNIDPWFGLGISVYPIRLSFSPFSPFVLFVFRDAFNESLLTVWNHGLRVSRIWKEESGMRWIFLRG